MTEPPPPFRALIAELAAMTWAEVDLSNDARFAAGVVVVTEQELVRLEAEGDAARIAQRWPLADLEELELKERDGWVHLHAKGQPELARATVAHLESLSTLRDEIVRWRDERERPSGGPATSNPCPSCGRKKIDGRCAHCRPLRRTLARLFDLVRPHARAFVTGGAMLLFGTVLSLAPPYLVKVLVDDVLKSGAGAWRLGLVVGGLGVTMLVSQLIGYGRSVVDSRLSGTMAHQMRVTGIRALGKLGLAEVARASNGRLMSTLNGDVESILDLMLNQAFTGAWHALMVAGILVALSWIDPRLTLFVVVPAPILVWSVYSMSQGGRRLNARLWAEHSHFVDALYDVIDGFRVVKAFHAEGSQGARLEAGSDRNRHWELVQAIYFGRFAPILSMTTGLASIVVWGWGGYQVLHGKLTVGGLVAYVSYLGMLYGHITSLGHVCAQMPRRMVSAERFFELLDTVPSVRTPERPVSLAVPVRGRLVLERVSFSYKAGREVLRDVDLTIEPGEMIGLVGRSGAGKTTLVNLVARFYDATRGRVLLDGVDVREIDIAELRALVGVVLQIPFLFEGSVLDNMRLGRPDATLKEVCLAADRAQAHDFIMAMPDGYDTVLKTGGHTLSAGERQRLTIARAILQDPRVLILDEATASVDTQTEKRIQDALGELVTGRTTIAIAHRLSTLGRADRLVAMDKGKIVDSGPHHELVARPGLYRDLFTAQEEMLRVQRMRGAVVEEAAA